MDIPDATYNLLKTTSLILNNTNLLTIIESLTERIRLLEEKLMPPEQVSAPEQVSEVILEENNI